MNKSLLILALTIIKDECISHDGCEECPLYDLKELKCGMLEQPDCWIIDNDEPCTEHILSV